MAVNFRGVVAGFRLPGVTTTPQNVICVRNTSVSGLYLALFEWTLYKDMTIAQAALTPVARVSIPTGTLAGGTPLTKVKHSDVTLGSNTSSASAIFTHGASADGTASAITGLTAGTTMWQTQPPRFQSLAGGFFNPEPWVIPRKCRDKPLIIPPASSLLLQMVSVGLTTDHYYTNVMWEEGTAVTDWG